MPHAATSAAPRFNPVIRTLHPGMGQAVAERTVLRKVDPQTGRRLSSPELKAGATWRWETWEEVAHRVATGNSLLCPNRHDAGAEHGALFHHIAKGTLLMSGRHLQHGDEAQPTRNQEVFTNCATSATSFAEFLLLLNGSGVGRCYDNDMMLVNWDNAPTVRCVLDSSHADFDWSAHESVRDAKHKYRAGHNVMWHEVADSREGWAKAIEVWETAAFEKIHKDKLLVMDFSKVRCKGSPIGGMQDRPASGPVPLMNAIQKAASIKGAGLDPWLQTMYVDHYLAECVLVGGARRAARMATKFWRDRNVLDFIRVKRPIEFTGLGVQEVIALRAQRAADKLPPLSAFLWSSNNSVTVDADFWRHVSNGLAGTHSHDPYQDEEQAHAMRVWKALTECSYGDGTGEPGLINVDKLVRNDEGWEDMEDGAFVGSAKYQVETDTRLLLSKLAKAAKAKTYNMIVNPCGEIVLNLLGAYCVIADTVPYHADTLEEAEHGFRTATRALMRVNLMDSLYRRETRRTNRIGVGITGIHEYAWKFFALGFRDLVSLSRYDIRKIAAACAERIGSTKTLDIVKALAGMHSETDERVAAFWLSLSHFKRAVDDEAAAYAKELGVAVPHTNTTIKPAGTTSKLFGLTEGWHLASMREFLRWVQFRNDDPLVGSYAAAGYPTRELVQYAGTTIVGFPTQPTICGLGMGDKLVTAAEASPEEQYRWLMLGEEFWIRGVDEDLQLLQPDRGNQISYTLKYDPKVVGFAEFADMMRKYQPLIRACSVMPQEDEAAYEYQPEEMLPKGQYEVIAAAIRAATQGATLAEEIGEEHVLCDGGACPVDFNRGEK